MSLKRIQGTPEFLLTGFLLFLLTLLSYSQQEASNSRRASPAGHTPSGQQIFASNCAGCHGLDGTGSQRAPNIVTNPQVQKLTATEIFHIVFDGVPETGMPPFSRLGKPAVTSVVAYVRNLQGKNRVSPLPGDPQRGEEIFFGSGQCSTCHTAAGRGGFIAPDLSAYGQTHSADKIRAAIINPAERDSIRSVVTATTANGERYPGIVRNEDNFSLQLQSSDGAFHFFSKADLKTIERAEGSIMPSDYATRLSAAELNDLVSYLLSLGRTSAPADSRREDE